jgi:hypothetical protein
LIEGRVVVNMQFFSLGVSYELAVKPARKLHSKNLPAEFNRVVGCPVQVFLILNILCDIGLGGCRLLLREFGR